MLAITFPGCAAGLSVDEACNGLADDLVALGFSLPSIYLLAGERLRCHAARGYFQVVDGFRPGVGVIGGVVASGVSTLVPDVRVRPDFLSAMTGVRAEACAPVRVHGEVVGAVSVESRTELPSATLQVVEAAARAVANRIAELGGLPRATLSQRVAQVSVDIAAAGTVAELEDRVVRAAADIAGMPTAAVIRLDEFGTRLTAAVGPLAAALRAWTVSDLDQLASWVIRGTSSHFPGGADSRSEHAFLDGAGVRSVSVHPMVAGGATSGVLVLVSEMPTALAPAVVDSLELLAAQGGALLGLLSALREVSRRADLDELTGLANRSCYPAAVSNSLASLRRPGAAVAVLLLDLDDFKHINDSLGHHAGDRLLREVATRITTTLRTGDTVCRLGGDEFAIVLPSSDRNAAQQTAERLLDALGEVVVLDGTVIEVSASIGIALSASSADAPEQLLRAADLAMYLAKSLGKGRYAVFKPEMQRAALGRRALESDLRDAVRQQLLGVVYQPILDLRTGLLSGVEALARWTDAERGPVPPSAFIPVAEQSGLVVPLGAWVVEQACEQLHLWDAAGGNPRLTMSVNVSTRQLERPGLLDVVDRCLATGLDPRRLILEITETALTGDAATALTTLIALRRRGVQVAVDDFGIGYSSLDRLRSAPICRLKIDKVFVGEINHHAAHVPIVDATLTMGRGLWLDVVAEGVETTEQLEYLREAQCPYAQGFLLARPLEAADVPFRPGDPLPWARYFPSLMAAPAA
ncbi:MAG: GGDEF-domain containing protein [Frankiales bacterium]|nr:GGDEF-domain containing protein [Frankiales bacterium]